METPRSHDEAIRGAAEQMREILDGSEQAIYIYLDDTHKVCNEAFASLLGYGSPEEWGRIEDPLAAGVAEKSQRAMLGALQKVKDRKAGSAFRATLKRRNGKAVETDLIMVPMAYEGHIMAVHFIQP